MHTKSFVGVALALTVASPAVAQTAPPSPPAVPTAPPPAPQEPPPAPEVSDPKLAPMPPPAHALRSWQETVQIAKGRSTSVRIARAEVERARGLSRQALAGALPSASGTASVTRTLFDTNDETSSAGAATTSTRDPWTWRASVTVTQPLLALREWHAIGTAKRAEQNAALSAEDQERLLLTGVAEALVGVIVAERVAELNRAGLRSALETLELTRTRERLGAANVLDVVRVQQDAAVARGVVVSGDESVRQAREALGVALGYGEPWGVTPGFDLGALEAGLRGACSPVDGAAARADVAAARGAVEIAQRGVTDVELGFAPSIDLSTTLGAEPARTGAGAAASWTVSGVLTVPIWDGGARYGSLRVARAGVDEAQQRLEAAERGVSVEASRALRGVEVAEEVRRVSAEARDLAVETDRLARIGFAAGRGTSLDLVQAAQQRRQAEVQTALKEFDLVGARIGALLAMSRCSASASGGGGPAR